MARLNEPPTVAGESIEALKRRFMRQNRELAKSNSTLNIKIANLEADRSQLLSDNITLREEKNQLRLELERNPSQRMLQNVGDVKDKLRSKVAELDDLMLLLDKAHTEKPRPMSAPKTSRRKSYQRSPTQQRNWRNTLYGPEVTGLAPIVEDKYFPIRTLDAEELQNQLPDLGAVAESPELGPPPVAHFDEGDPVKHDLIGAALGLSASEREQNNKEAEVAQGLGFANLETRRRRRGSSLVKEAATVKESEFLPVVGTESENVNTTIQPLRIGAKRKFSNYNEENPAVKSTQPDSDGFAFSRKVDSENCLEPDGTSSRTVVVRPALISKPDKSRDTLSTRSIRKALGEKSINTDPVVSPAKPKSRDLVKTNKLDKDYAAKPRPREKPKAARDVDGSEHRQSSRDRSKQVGTESEGPLPITPAPPPSDLFSPSDTQPSTSRPDSRDTPPPTDINAQTTEGARPSRRTKAAISYAEPSLRDKMRRPGKQLADAVVPSSKPSARTKPEIETVLPEPEIKKEDADSSEWQSLPVSQPHKPIEPTSPLGNKSSQNPSALPPTIITDRRRRSSAIPRNLEDSSAPSGVSQSTLAALVAGSQKRLSRAREAAEAQKRISGGASERSNLDVYDFQGSSSPKRGGGVNASAEAEREGGEKVDMSRQARLSGTTIAGGGEKGEKLARRHSSMADVRNGAGAGAGLVRPSSAATGLVGREKVRERDGKKTDDGGGGGGIEEGERGKAATLSRGERAAARRRSMMV